MKTLYSLLFCCIFYSNYAQDPATPEGGMFDFLYNLKTPEMPGQLKNPYMFVRKGNTAITIEGDLKESKPAKVKFSDGTYEGSVVMYNKKEKEFKLKKGTYTFTNGDVYQGDFTNNSGIYYTNGTYLFKNGIKLVFSHQPGKIQYYENVKGVYHYQNGDSCVVDYYDDEVGFHFYPKTGAHYYGSISHKTRNLLPNSYVNYYHPSGVTYKGKLSKSLPDGWWLGYNQKNEQVQSAYFNKGKLLGVVDVTPLERTAQIAFFINNKMIAPSISKVNKNGNVVYCYKGDGVNGNCELFETDWNYIPKFYITKGTFKDGQLQGDATRTTYDHELNVIAYGKGKLVNYLVDGDYMEATVDGKTSFVGKYAQGIKVSGMETFEDGRIFNGSYQNELPKNGSMTFPNKERYEGEFNETGMRGAGKYFFTNGERIESSYFHHEYAVGCTYYKADGTEYFGEYDFKKREFSSKDYIADFKVMMKSLDDAKNQTAQQQQQQQSYSQGRTCGSCNGSGNNVNTCPMCKGSGQSETWMKVDSFGRYAGKGTCIYCRGNGTISVGSCGTCHGSGRVN
ncbi:hypothetical protein HKT18_05665 [Flavobacterium sp. IMCC34852]|uniref:CR-type domain-containing protein n=1 Tax=Flavobacterium rivulicola TaxID=2732161 RepID=A0A7Y3VYR6_9FLAO|nr:hypothetical protein [Flavobacterium sp. IMCC34852]NNT71701.1 hypothetical protein [Flavobacterium sp. IMCC34852]